MLVWELLLVILLADFVSGFVHWAEDAYARPDMPWLKKIAEENLLHDQTPRHHSQHHRGHNDTHYCVLTNLLNPILDQAKFWRVLEYLIRQLTGMQVRPILK
ncbi:MAG: fatty acid desaturase CarF family protein [Burkholderiales bacterium]|jgi:hypothetical protein